VPSPFPGMDPFIEGQEWEDFHTRFITALADSLLPGVRPRYVVRVERRVYLEHVPEGPAGFINPDVMVLERPEAPSPPAEGAGGTATLVAVTPVVLSVPMPERRREAYLTVRERESMEVITVIEVLSPSNKRSGSDGRQEYLSKREAVLLSGTHLVELDLLRGGKRLPTNEPLPPGDYYAIVSRAARRPRVDVYAWPLRHPLPTIPVPLTGNDPAVPLDLQAVFNTVYDRAGYDYSLDYRRPVEPPLSEADAPWAQEVADGRDTR
jgi:uncharacterized protein DUF4058